MYGAGIIEKSFPLGRCRVGPRNNNRKIHQVEEWGLTEKTFLRFLTVLWSPFTLHPSSFTLHIPLPPKDTFNFFGNNFAMYPFKR
jgi:hypothetical protein